MGRYHILEQLGEGGMAIVYKAYDTRVETDVAVKVIRTENLPQNAIERALKRFEREAKALARLTHPNIVKVMDYGEYEGKPYLIMPYFPGGTLKEKMGKPIPWREAFQILLPIAEALDYAHSQKMVHRDVKPSNILLTERGQPMLTDFGIAKILELEETQDLTGTSAALGTPEYMAPEQATARMVDHRADIYAFGIVLYEMLIGRKPYTADTPLAILIKHAHDPLPSPKMFVPDLPDAVERILLKALAKKPEDRYQSMGEMVKAFENLQGNSGSQPVPKTISKEGKRKLNIIIILSLTALVLMAVFGLPLLIGKPEPTLQASTTPIDTATQISAPTQTASPMSTADLLAYSEELQQCGSDICIVKSDGSQESLGIGEEYSIGPGNWFSWSPDDTQIVFYGCLLKDVGGQWCANLYIAPRDKSGIKPLIIEPNIFHHAVIWSPDGEWIAFSSNGIELIHPDGSGRHTIIKTSGATCPGYMAWSPDSQKLAWIGGGCMSPPQHSRVWVASIDGQQLDQIFYTANGYFDHDKGIAWSPDGQFVVVRHQDGTTYQIDAGCSVQSNGCDESSRTEINEIPKDWLHTFRPQWLNANTKPTNTSNTLEQGKTLTMCDNDLCVVNSDGSRVTLSFGQDYELAWPGAASWSPDGTQFVFSACLTSAGVASGCLPDLFTANWDGSNIIPVIINPNSHDTMPVWSPDGQWIAYGNNGGVAIVKPDGTGKKELVIGGSLCPVGIGWSPDSQQIAFQGGDGDCTQSVTLDSVWALNADGTNQRRILKGADPRLVETAITWSPDGQSVVVMQENGKGLSINPNCISLPTGCDESSRTKLDSFPKDWLTTFYPQWGETQLP